MLVIDEDISIEDWLASPARAGIFAHMPDPDTAGAGEQEQDDTYPAWPPIDDDF